MNEMRLQGKHLFNFLCIFSRLVGLFLRVARDLPGSTLISNGTNYTTSSAIHTAELRNLDIGAAFYILRQNDTTYV